MTTEIQRAGRAGLAGDADTPPFHPRALHRPSRTFTVLDGVSYPSGDGRPMGETQIHIQEIIRLFQTLQDHFANDERVFLAADLLLYFDEGNRRAFVSPDIFVVQGVKRDPPRTSYFLWVEGRIPNIALEVDSRSTRGRDQRQKRAIYEQLGIPEYILYEPVTSPRRPPFRLLRLASGIYQPVDADSDGSWVSRQLGVRLCMREGRLRLFDAATDAPLLSPSERVVQLEAEIARLRGRLNGDGR